MKLLKINTLNRIALLTSLIITLSYVLGFYLKEDSAGGGFIDFNHIFNNYKLIFLNKFSEINWSNYESSRFPLMYFLFKFYLPYEVEILKINIFCISLVTPIIFYFSIKKKASFFKEKHSNYVFLSLSTILFLSPYFRTSGYWLLEENFGFFCIILSTFFLFCSFDKLSKNSYFYIFLSIIFSYIAFYSSQNLFYFVIANFILSFKEFGFNNKKFFLVVTLNVILFFPLILFYDFFLKTLTSAIAVGRFSVSYNNIVDIGAIIFIYILPVYFLFFKHEENFTVKLKKNIFKYLIFIIFFVFIFFQYEIKFLGGGAILKLLLFFFGDGLHTKVLYLIISALSYLLIYEVIKKEKIFLLFILSNIFLYIWIQLVFQEYFDPSLLIFCILYFNKVEIFSISKILILKIYLILFLIGANIYYIFLQ